MDPKELLHLAPLTFWRVRATFRFTGGSAESQREVSTKEAADQLLEEWLAKHNVSEGLIERVVVIKRVKRTPR